ncbi:hypothetical protein KRMM14A1004_56440 [Krasilnikovia sp. MM14-A1004]
MRWTLSASEIREVNICPAALSEVDELGNETICLLFAGHPGRHSYEIEGG